MAALPWWLNLVVQMLIKFGPTVVLKLFPSLLDKVKSLPQEVKDLIAALLRELEAAPTRQDKKAVRAAYAQKCSGTACPTPTQEL